MILAKARELITPKLVTNKSAILDAYRMLSRVPGPKHIR